MAKMRRLAADVFALALAATLPSARSTKWTLYGGAGTGPNTAVKELASAMVARYPDELDISVWLSTGSHAQKALVGSVDCASKYRGHPTLCSSPPAVNSTDFGTGGVTFSSSWYSRYSSLDIQQLPSLAGPICVIYSKDITGNLGSAGDMRLNLTMEVVGAIFGGHITFWDDSRVQALNPALTLPHERITVVARSDKSSLNEAVTSAISFANPWWTQVPGYMGQSVGKTPNWPMSSYTDASDPYYMLQDGQEGIIVNALRKPFSLAYVDFTQIRRFGEFLGMARIVNNFTGMPVPPTAETVQNAIDAYSSDFSSNNSRMELSALNPQRDGAYPITRFVYWYVTKSAASNGDCFRTWLLKEFILFCYSPAASAIADRNGWVIPPDSLVQAVRTKLAEMRCVDAESGAEMSVMAYTPPKYRRCPRGQFIAPRPGGFGIESHLGCRDCSAGTYQPQHLESGIFQCNAAPAGTFVSRAAQWTTEPCARGTFSGTAGKTNCLLCPAGTFSPSAGLTECAACPVGRSTNAQEGAQLCEPCAPGRFTDSPRSSICAGCPTGLTTKLPGAGDISFCRCPPGFHMDATRVCRECSGHEGLVCPGDGEPAQAAPGYMLVEAGVQPGPLPAVYRCMTPGYCPGGSPLACAGGRVGVACARCPEGQIWEESSCQVCSKSGAVWIGLWFCFVMAVGIFWLGFEVYSKQAMIGDRYITKLAMAGSITSLVSVAQCVGLLSLLTVPWPESLISFVRGSGVFVLDVENLLSLACGAHSTMGQYTVTALSVPVAILAMVAAQAIRCCVAKARYASPDFLNALGALVFVALTPLMTSAVLPMMCYTHPAGTKSLIKYPSVLCGSGEHHSMLTLGFFLFLLCLFIMSVLVAVTWKAPALASVPGTSTSFLRATRFILLPYREDRWYAGCMLAPRGLLVALVPVALADSVHGQVTFFVMVLVVCMCYLARFWPWRLPLLNVVNLVVMQLLVVAIAIVAVAFVPATAAGTSTSSFYAGLLQVILVFAMAIVGLLIAIIFASVLARLFGVQTGSALRSLLHFGGGRCNSEGLAELMKQLAGLPLKDLSRAVANLEMYDQQTLVRSLSAFKELKKDDSRKNEAWQDQDRPSSSRSLGRMTTRCMSESALAMEAIFALEVSDSVPSQGDFKQVLPVAQEPARLQQFESEDAVLPSEEPTRVKVASESGGAVVKFEELE